MALDMLTASQGRVCALAGAECCVYIPDVHHNVSQAPRALASETRTIEHLIGDPLQEGWTSLTNEWQWVCVSWVAALEFCLHAVAVCTAVAASGCRALPSLPMDPCRRHPHIDCMVRNPEGMDCMENGVSQAPSPGCPGNCD